DRSHKEAVAARREMSKVYGSPIRKLAPVVARAFELVLISKSFAGVEPQSHEIHLNLILIRPELERGNFCFAKRRDRMHLSADAQSCNQNRSRQLRRIRLRTKT